MLLWRHRGRVALGLLALLAVDAVQVWSPWLLAQAVDDLKADRFDRIGTWALAIAGVGAAMVLLRILWRELLVGTARVIRHDLRRDLVGHALRLPARVRARTSTGDLMALATNDLDAIAMACGFGLMATFDAAMMGAFALGALLWTDWRIALAVAAPLPLLGLFVWWSGRIVHRRFGAIQALFGTYTESLREHLTAARVVKAAAGEAAAAARLADRNRDHLRANLRLVPVSALSDPAITAIAGLGGVLLLLVGGAAVVEGRISAGTFVAMSGWLAMLAWPMMAVGWSINILSRGRAALDRFAAILAEPAETPPADALPLPPGPPPIAVRDLRFTYPGAPAPALDGVDLDLAAGTVLGIAGPTGAGKSTLAWLLLGIEEPPPGSIRHAGIAIERLDRGALRRRAAIVAQEPLAFAMSVADNIAFARPGATRDAVARAAALAGLERDLAAWPAGLDTEVGERGVTLSGGQRQRVAIARALLADPDLLILDDALSAVDARTEAEILAHLARERRGRTTLIVSHRTSALAACDRVVVIDRGRIVEAGTPAALAAGAGWYADLARLEAAEARAAGAAP
jgi:ATP-binding cassette subfamily B protein